jgi:hypothetical protein
MSLLQIYPSRNLGPESLLLGSVEYYPVNCRHLLLGA